MSEASREPDNEPLWEKWFDEARKLHKENASLRAENARLTDEVRRGQWVKVSERMPSEASQYFVAWKSGQVEVIQFMSDIFGNKYWSKFRAIDEITHWMPFELPNPPKD